MACTRIVQVTQLIHFVVGGVLIVLWLKVWSAALKWVSSNSSHAIMFTFRQIPLGKVWTPFSPQMWVEYYYCHFSTRIALVSYGGWYAIKQRNQTILLLSLLPQYVSSSLVKPPSAMIVCQWSSWRDNQRKYNLPS